MLEKASIGERLSQLHLFGATQAFQAAWAAACKKEASTILVPSQSVFLVGPISFSGPDCESNIVFQLDGKIAAPTSSKAWSSGPIQWLEFSKLRGITVKGQGSIDGQGSVWWKDSSMNDPIDDETTVLVPMANNTEEENSQTPSFLDEKMPTMKPTALRFYGSSSVIVSGITILNSPQCHLKFDNCMGVEVSNVKVTSPGDSPNTDGIHLQNSKDVLIHSTSLACGKLNFRRRVKSSYFTISRPVMCDLFRPSFFVDVNGGNRAKNVIQLERH